MSFISLEFLVLMAVTLPAYHLLPARARQALLLLASYAFYGYWKWSYLGLIVVSTVLDYVAAIGVRDAKSPRARRGFLAASIVGNLALLGYFKYTDFGIAALRPLLARFGLAIEPLHLILPAGISFYTFQTMGYTIDVYRGKIEPTRDFVLMAAYVAFFPQLVAGPIERGGTLIPQLAAYRPFSLARLGAGVPLILSGLFKKLVVGDRFYRFAAPNFADPASAGGAELAVSLVLRGAALYMDFSAYTDLARGTGRMFGVELTENFRHPLSATNPLDFWSRWHITLTRWIYDYLFVPMGAFVRSSPLRTARNVLVAMTLIGLWHGGEWKFVLWGFLTGAILLGHFVLTLHVLPGWARRYRGASVVGWALTSVVIFLSGIPFYAPDLPRAWLFFRLLGTSPWSDALQPPLLAAYGALALLYAWEILGRRFDGSGIWGRVPGPLRGVGYALFFYVIFFAGAPTAQRFEYFQF